MTTIRCIAPDCGSVNETTGEREPRLAIEGALLCQHHSHQIKTALPEIPDLYATLDPSAGAVQRYDDAPGAKYKDPPAPGSLDVMSMLDLRTGWTGAGPIEVHGMLSSWARLVAEERRVAQPEDTLTAITSFLLRHHDWIISALWVDDYYAEISEALAQLRRATGTRRQSFGRCYLYTEVGKCTGTLIQRPDGVVTCTYCKQTWASPREWAILQVALSSSSEYSTSTPSESSRAEPDRSAG